MDKKKENQISTRTTPPKNNKGQRKIYPMARLDEANEPKENIDIEEKEDVG